MSLYAPSVPAAVADPQRTEKLRVASVVSALSQALDLSTGQPPGHSMRACVVGVRIGREMGLAAETLDELYYALLLKDCGCSGNASMTFHALGSDDIRAKRDVKTTNWTSMSWETVQYALSHVAVGRPFLERSRAIFRMALNQKAHARNVTKIRCERGSGLARLMGLSPVTAFAILNLDEHWDGTGNPDGLRKEEIPLLSRIMLLAQTLEVFRVSSGAESGIQIAEQRSGKWFDPDTVRAAVSVHKKGSLWTDAEGDELSELCLRSETEPKILAPGETTLDNICMAFSDIVDAKSPFTFNHSLGVANAAVAAARMLGLSPERIVFLRSAALLHDLGKLSVSNAILEKPAKLDDDEWEVMKRHPFHTWRILSAIPGFGEVCEVAGSHHEKLDGTGYFRGVTGEYLSTEARILAVADIFDALSANRPYRDGLPLETVFGILRRDAKGLDMSCVEALEQSGAACDQTLLDLENLKKSLNL